MRIKYRYEIIVSTFDGNRRLDWDFTAPSISKAIAAAKKYRAYSVYRCYPSGRDLVAYK